MKAQSLKKNILSKENQHYISHLSKFQELLYSESVDIMFVTETWLNSNVSNVQAVQTIPKLEASCLYFKTRLNLHNYTVYNIGTQEVVCYVWPETSAGLTASVFASCLLDYLDEQITETPSLEQIIMWSDGCGAQNRNVTLLSAISIWAK
jgi:hypothetical protein